MFEACLVHIKGIYHIYLKNINFVIKIPLMKKIIVQTQSTFSIRALHVINSLVIIWVFVHVLVAVILFVKFPLFFHR